VYSEDDIEYASQLHKKAVAVLDSQKLPLTPINYSVLYSHVSQRQKELTQTIKDYLASGKLVNNDFLRELFDKYLLEQARFKDEMIKPFGNMIGKMISQVSEQVKSEEGTVAALNSVEFQLSSVNGKIEVEKVIADLGGITLKAKQEHQGLFEELNSAQQEISLLKNKLAASEKEAKTDPLTGLLNRRGLKQSLLDIEAPENTSCIIVDIDHFKALNDTYGHPIGDRIIKRVANEIQLHIRGRDLAVRFGGEEFVILLIDTPLEGAERVAETLRKKIESLQLVIKSNNTQLPPIRISLGVADFQANTHWEDLLKRADEALYSAKENGRNQTKVNRREGGVSA
jgi:diguanylate cyclase